jgi:hypothetical protein
MYEQADTSSIGLNLVYQIQVRTSDCHTSSQLTDALALVLSMALRSPKIRAHNNKSNHVNGHR